MVTLSLVAAVPLMSINTPETFQLSRLVPALLLVQNWFSPQMTFNYLAWSIKAEWAMYLLLPALRVIRRRGLLRAGVVASLAMLSLIGPWTGTMTLRAVPSILLGMWLFDRRAFLRIPGTGWLTAGCLTLFLIATAMGWSFLAMIATMYGVAVCAVPADQARREQVLAPGCAARLTDLIDLDAAPAGHRGAPRLHRGVRAASGRLALERPDRRGRRDDAGCGLLVLFSVRDSGPARDCVVVLQAPRSGRRLVLGVHHA